MPASRNKRYNTLDLASKIVCQRQALPALLWKPPGYRQRHFSAPDRNVFCRYSFSPMCHKNAKSVFVTARENEKRQSPIALKQLDSALLVERLTNHGQRLDPKLFFYLSNLACSCSGSHRTTCCDLDRENASIHGEQHSRYMRSVL